MRSLKGVYCDASLDCHLPFSGNIWETGKRNSDPQTVFTIRYSELKISLKIHENVADSYWNEAKVSSRQFYPS